MGFESIINEITAGALRLALAVFTALWPVWAILFGLMLLKHGLRDVVMEARRR